ncbi:LysR family transcriptional regulator [Paenibacillus nasutitermitis]|uniref:HTH-type transcriptional regulator YwbI n=1 Tax=Paenibacillus nasutitermitis TaxID=1652958 RepID=A0A917DT04_9BACL|nr:LysR family transcriptional regulator [Paenibacillus nasutitermitis]GGD64315.1 putative HTH-type transcriptional regulator YwbI [Paenibacillus nasutitermitis]
MDLRQLSYFLEVARYASFSKASQAIHLSQPTLSKMVKNLEDELGLVLLDRSTRRVVLTEAGRVVQAHAQTVINASQQLLAAVLDLKEMRQGQFTLGLPPVIGASFFPKVIAEFHQIHPDITIQIVEEGGKRIEQLLLEGEIDLGVVVLPVDEVVFEVVPIVKRHLNLVVPLEHPLSNRRKVRLAELKEEPFILFRQEFNLHDRVKEACIGEGFEPRVAYESSQWDFIYELICANQGISLLPETICAKLDPAKVRVIRQIEPGIHWDLAIIWKKGGYISHAAQGWIDFALRVLIPGSSDRNPSS